MPTGFDSKPSITLEFPALGAGARRPKFEKFPVLFPVNREFGCRDGFDNDCVRHHALCRNGKSLRDWRIASNRRASAWRLGLRGDCFRKRGDFGRVVSGPRIPIPRCSIGTWGVDSESEPASLNTEHLFLARPLCGRIAHSRHDMAVRNPFLPEPVIERIGIAWTRYADRRQPWETKHEASEIPRRPQCRVGKAAVSARASAKAAGNRLSPHAFTPLANCTSMQ